MCVCVCVCVCVCMCVCVCVCVWQVIGMVRAGKTPPDVETVDDTPISNAWQAAPERGEARKARAKP
jgi:hypothetical protein